MKRSWVLLLLAMLLLGGCGSKHATDARAPEGTVFENDWSIITKEGHPQYWDSVEQTHLFWDSAEKGKILFPDSRNSYDSKKIIIMGSTKNENGIDVTDNIEVYFQNSTDPILITVEEVLPVVASYLPIEAMKAYYEIGDAFIAIPKEGENGETHYIALYWITEEGKAEDQDLPYRIFIEIQVDNETVKMFRITNMIPKWTYYLERNGYLEEQWDFDFLNS